MRNAVLIKVQWRLAGNILAPSLCFYTRADPMNTLSSSSNPLGQNSNYPTAYDPSLLFRLARDLNREQLPKQRWQAGADIWNAYEMSWLNPKGKPLVAIARFTVPHDSPYLIESKSLKLYLNSLNEERYSSIDKVSALLERDLSAAAGATVTVELTSTRHHPNIVCQALAGTVIDDLDISVTHSTPAPELLRCLPNAPRISETLTSDLLKSNCPVTGQPDWASVQIRYTGAQIDPESLLQYIVSLRRHTEFHEHCVEKMYCDIWQACQPQSLLVYARYTRRGGLDINPWRSSEVVNINQDRGLRQ